MVPITSPGVISTFKPPVVTALSLAEYANLMGINPIQFMSGLSNAVFPSTGCTDRWRQYPWQDEDKTSRDELAREIHQAEKDIAAQLGYWPGRLWTEGEFVVYPHYYKRAWTSASGTNVAGYYKSVSPKHGKFIDQGVRSVELVGTATVLPVDEDGDSYEETALLSIATSYTNPYELKVFYAGEGGAQEYEIRPVTEKSISGGTLEIRLPVWLLFKPELLAAMPGSDGYQELDPFDQNNLVETVDIYRVTVDRSQGNLFHWNGSSTLADDVVNTTQTIALEPKVEHRIVSAVTLTPATYNAGADSFAVAQFAVAREPDQIELAYLSGDFQADAKAGEYRVPDDLAQAIMSMATARLSRPLCSQCQNVQEKEKRLRFDMALSVVGDSSDVRFVRPDVLRCPFGTRVGEVTAWDIVRARTKEGDIAPQVAAF
jgi:hypothetical protein